MGLINEWCLPDLEDKIGSNDGGATGSDDGQELDLSKLRTFKDFVAANSDLIDFGDCGNVKSLVMVVSLDSTTQSFLQNNANGVSASSGTLAYTDFDNAFVDGVDTNTITTGWHCIVITSTTDVACTNLELGHIGATYGDFKCAYLATYSEDLSAAQIQRIKEEKLLQVNSRNASATYRYLPPKNTVRDGLVNEYFLDSPAGVNTVNDYQGTNDGTKGGATKPASAIAPNGMNSLAFTGGNGATGGNRQRVEFTRTSFEYTTSSNFSIAILFKSTKADATYHSLFNVIDTATTGAILFYLDTNEKLASYIQTAGGTNNKVYTSTASYCDGKWHLAVLTFASSGLAFNMYIDGVLHNEGATSAGTLSGNFYSTNAKATLGARYFHSSTIYEYDTSGSIAYVANYNKALSALEVDKIYRDTFIN